MSYRTVFISKPANLKISKNRLAIIQNSDIFTIPLEDIAMMIFDSYQVSFTGQVLTALATNNIVLISCDETHIPNGIFHSYLPHSRQNLVLSKQLSLGAVFKRKIWHMLVMSKLENQLFVLKTTSAISDKEQQKLVNIIENLRSGDKDNKEAVVSRFYFPKLFGNEFIRKGRYDNINNNEYFDKLNILLNYTYTVLRSLIIRTIVGYGLLPILGIFHDNQQNSFNLADDFIEPFRPYVDWYVYRYVLKAESVELTVDSKYTLVDILNHLVIIDDKQQTIINAVDVMVSSYVFSINHNDYKCLKTPRLPESISRSNLD